MKYLCLLFSLFFATNGFSSALHHFSDIKSAVIKGKSIHIVTDFSQCTGPNKKALQSTHIGAFEPKEIQVIGNHIATSFTHFTLNNPAYPNNPVYEFVRYTINQDDNLSLSYQALDARTFSTLSDKIIFNCKLNVGAKVYI